MDFFKKKELLLKCKQNNIASRTGILTLVDNGKKKSLVLNLKVPKTAEGYYLYVMTNPKKIEKFYLSKGLSFYKFEFKGELEDDVCAIVAECENKNFQEIASGSIGDKNFSKTLFSYIIDDICNKNDVSMSDGTVNKFKVISSYSNDAGDNNYLYKNTNDEMKGEIEYDNCSENENIKIIDDIKEENENNKEETILKEKDEAIKRFYEETFDLISDIKDDGLIDALNDNLIFVDDLIVGEKEVKDMDEEDNFLNYNKTDAQAKERFFDSVKNEVIDLFNNFEREETLEKIIPESKWVKVSFDETGRYYVVGIVTNEEEVEFICYGIPTKKTDRLPEHLKGIAEFIETEENKGYFMMYQDADTGYSVSCERV